MQRLGNVAIVCATSGFLQDVLNPMVLKSLSIQGLQMYRFSSIIRTNRHVVCLPMATLVRSMIQSDAILSRLCMLFRRQMTSSISIVYYGVRAK